MGSSAISLALPAVCDSADSTYAANCKVNVDAGTLEVRYFKGDFVGDLFEYGFD